MGFTGFDPQKHPRGAGGRFVLKGYSEREGQPIDLRERHAQAIHARLKIPLEQVKQDLKAYPDAAPTLHGMLAVKRKPGKRTASREEEIKRLWSKADTRDEAMSLTAKATGKRERDPSESIHPTPAEAKRHDEVYAALKQPWRTVMSVSLVTSRFGGKKYVVHDEHGEMVLERPVSDSSDPAKIHPEFAKGMIRTAWRDALDALRTSNPGAFHANAALIAHFAESQPEDSALRRATIPLRLAQHFNAMGLGAIHAEQTVGWVNSSSSKEAQRLHAELAALGVPGTHPLTDSQLHHAIDAGQGDNAVRRYVREMYGISQASLRAEGVERLTLYRGVQVEPKQEYGEGGYEFTNRIERVQKDMYRTARDYPVRIGTRPASSWSDEREPAQDFAGSAGFVLKAEIPASHVYTSWRLFGNYSGENEYVVLGMDRRAVDVSSRNDRLVRAIKEPASDDDE